MFRDNQKTLVLTSVVNYLRTCVANYFSYISNSDLGDYMQEANFVARQMSLDKGKVSVKKLALIDLETKRFADSIKQHKENVDGVSPDIKRAVGNLADELYSACVHNNDFSKKHIQTLCIERSSKFLKLARDVLYSKLEPEFVAAAKEITHFQESTSSVRNFGAPRPNM